MNVMRALRSEAVHNSPTSDLPGFEPLRAPSASSASFPRSLKIAVWNCRGMHNKELSIRSLLTLTNVDILVLNETFRRPQTPWPTDLPPCLAEATSQSASNSRFPNGVAVIANPRSLGHRGAIRSFSIIEIDNVNGMKIVLKVNQFTIFAIYAPTSAGVTPLTEFAMEAKQAASSGSPVIFCGDLNASHTDDVGHLDYSQRRRYRALAEHLGPPFFRVDTGTEATRPANRIDARNIDGTFIDHIFVANANGLDGRCLSSFGHRSDHHPLTARIVHRNPLKILLSNIGV